VDKQNTSMIASDFQIHPNRIIRAAGFAAQSSLLLRQESADLLSVRDAKRLRGISDGLDHLVLALNSLGASRQQVGCRG